ncbi:Wzz/FepE/Etk N-terminal domain-containing protein [Hydrogenophaga sp.]|uniref:Wzz/FepE/Etk N-terminal domain-containing protein n=1 Tax=Hydrogenophaga sp. TaxID=1904254 RepID=UPI002730896F|nr:Wzz/FepE/Etk N-terminal domain-containing protein [Hydrogenophaga sp.]MDP2017929.1 Wzz/FepE/Etk N-terminal domain-containing protein [Hydrogenophaga sp.]MDP3164614.1 Wzz/FepE/Etk N-terminal domain-containing protein [Hydrogenophaga sp.]
MDQNSPAETAGIEDTIDLFDVLLTLAENIWLLVLGPLLAGALVYGLTFLLPQKFQSTAILRAEADVASFMTTATVLDTSLTNLGFLKDLSEEEAEQARIDLNKRITTQVGRNDKLVTLTVTANSPKAAQSMANEILTHTFAGLRPKGAELKRLETQKATLEQQISELQITSKTAQKLLDESSPAGNMGLLAESISSLSAAQIRMQETLLAVEKRMQGLTDEDLLQPPTLPKKPAAPKKGLNAILTVVGTGFLMLIFVLLRQYWGSSSTLELHQHRLDALKRRYGFGR